MVRLFKKESGGTITCQACSHFCHIEPGRRGLCGVRKNEQGKLKLLVDNQVLGLSVDPIEKKPLYHFLPGSQVFSFGTFGCNFSCQFCQNAFMSQSPKLKKYQPIVALKELIAQYSQLLKPAEIIAAAQRNNCPAIAYTYNEPTVFVEYAYQIMKLARQNGLKNIWVTNGYQSKECFHLIKDYLDAANIDLKSMREEFYQRICGAHLKPVLENIKRFYQAGIWLELTTLVIPGQNDSVEELMAIAAFIADISPDIPWHVSAFHPIYKMKNVPITPLEKLKEARKIGQKAGLKHIHLGNISF